MNSEVFTESAVKAGILTVLYRLTDGKIDLTGRLKVTFTFRDGNNIFTIHFDEEFVGNFKPDSEIETYDSTHLMVLCYIANMIFESKL